MTDLIALRGDQSDGIPGARGVGAKTAARLLQVHDSLEGVLLAAGADGPQGEPGQDPVLGDGMTPRLAALLRDQATSVRRDHAVALLHEADVEDVPDRELDRVGGADAAEALGMTRLAADLRAS